jgi:acyl dehydratase
MALDCARLMDWPFAEVEQTYTAKDSILYALGVGYGADPLDARQLRFAYEKNQRAVPTMAVVLAGPGFWVREPGTGITWQKYLHGEQQIIWHRPLPPAATVTACTKVTGIIDKGEGRGALITVERTLKDKATGADLATLSNTGFARADGGFGGPAGQQPAPHALPDRPADLHCDLPTLPQSALLYRLTGDPNPLHADPDVAAAGGFKAPILHGLCTLGVAGHAVLRCCCGYDPARLKSLKLRFSSPVYPGETIRTEIWQDSSVVSFRATAVERGAVVLNNGRAEITV